MTTDADTQQQRASKQFWAIDDAWQAVHVTGYECPPNDDTWWVPELGYSLNTKHHLFATEQEARDSGVKKLNLKIAELTKALEGLQTGG